MKRWNWKVSLFSAMILATGCGSQNEGTPEAAGQPAISGRLMQAGSVSRLKCDTVIEATSTNPSPVNVQTGCTPGITPEANAAVTAGMTPVASLDEASAKLQECLSGGKAGLWYQDPFAKYWFECCAAGYKVEKTATDERFYCRPMAAAGSNNAQVSAQPSNAGQVNGAGAGAVAQSAFDSAGMTQLPSMDKVSEEMQKCNSLGRGAHWATDGAGQAWFQCCQAGERLEQLAPNTRFYCKPVNAPGANTNPPVNPTQTGCGAGAGVAQPCSLDTTGMTQLATQDAVNAEALKCSGLRQASHWFSIGQQFWFQCCPAGQYAIKTGADERFYCRTPGASPVNAPSNTQPNTTPSNTTPDTTTPDTTTPDQNGEQPLIAGMSLASTKAEAEAKLAECALQGRYGHLMVAGDQTIWYQCCPVGQKAVKLPTDLRYYCKAS